MIDKASAVAWIKGLLTPVLDDELFAAGGFKRPVKSLVYGRTVTDGKQKIYLDLLVRPRYAPDAFHLVLRASIVFSEMAAIASAMLGDHAAGYGKDGTVHVAVLDQIVRNPPMNLFKTERELSLLVPQIQEQATTKIVAYLDARDSIEKLTSSMWQSWSANYREGTIAGRWPVMIAAGQLAVGDRTAALETLETCYPEGSGERTQYHVAFDIVTAA